MKSINRKLIPAITAALVVVFVINNYMFIQMLKDEVLNQWKIEDTKLVKAYAQIMHARDCSTTEEYQSFIDDINSENNFNYALYMEDVEGEVTAIAHSNPERIGLILEDAGSLAAARDGEEYAGYYTDPVTGGMTLDVLTPIYNDAGELNGALNIGIPIDDATMGSIISETIQKATIVCTICALALIVLLSLSLHLFLLRPLNLLGNRIEKLSRYDLRLEKGDILEKYAKRTDEIGMISTGFIVMQESLSKMITNIRKVADKLTSQSRELSGVSNEVNESSVQLSKTVEEVAQGSTTQAQQTSEGNIQMGRLNELIGVVEDNMESLKKATEVVGEIEKQGMEVLDGLVEKTAQNNASSKQVHIVMEETSHQTDKIKNASDQIRGIAGQTNLLALNASIEAARAGEAGRGFAVVATEIGNLAQETNTLTTEIESIINELFEKMQEAVSTVAGMERLSEEQNQNVDKTREKFDEITKTTLLMEAECEKFAESTENMKESRRTIMDVINDLSALSEENAACMEEAAASVNTQSESIEKVSATSKEVAELAKKLKTEIEKFII